MVNDSLSISVSVHNFSSLISHPFRSILDGWKAAKATALLSKQKKRDEEEKGAGSSVGQLFSAGSVFFNPLSCQWSALWLSLLRH